MEQDQSSPGHNSASEATKEEINDRIEIHHPVRPPEGLGGSPLSSNDYEDLREKIDALSASIAEILRKLQAVETTLSERTKNLETQIAENSGDVSDLQDLYRDCRERCVKDQARLGHRVDDLLKPINEKLEKLFRYVYIALGMIMLLQFVLR